MCGVQRYHQGVREENNPAVETKKAQNPLFELSSDTTSPWWFRRLRICLPMQGMWVQSLVQEDCLKGEMATHSSILAWEIPWTEEPDGL